MKVIDKKPDEGAPSVLDMNEQDARHSVAVAPERYELVPPTLAELRAEMRSRASIEQRVAALEDLVDKVTAESEPTPAEPPKEPETTT